MTTATKTSSIYVRVDPKTKSEVDKVCNDMGLTPARAINMFLTKVAKEKRIPFEVTAVPSLRYLDELTKEEVVNLIAESDEQIKNGKYTTLEEFIKHSESL